MKNRWIFVGIAALTLGATFATQVQRPEVQEVKAKRSASNVLRLGGQTWVEGFDRAKAQAQNSGKPILMLQMFGRLDEEICCNNASTLRATVFKDPAYAKWLGENFVLAWESLRPVPKVTIEFPDGRKVTRAVSGNAVTFVLDSKGQALDFLPGLYTPKDYQDELAKSAKFATEYQAKSKAEATQLWREFHPSTPSPVLRPNITVGKAAVESSVLNNAGLNYNPRRLFATPNPLPRDVSRTPMPYNRVVSSTGFDSSRPLESLQNIISRDSKNNLLVIRPMVHNYLGRFESAPDYQEISEDIFETILDVDLSDKDLGLRIIPTMQELLNEKANR